MVHADTKVSDHPERATTGIYLLIFACEPVCTRYEVCLCCIHTDEVSPLDPDASEPDVNEKIDSKDATVYIALDSDGDEGFDNRSYAGSVSSDDNDSDNQGDTTAAEERFYEDFLQLVGGEDTIASGRIRLDILKEMSTRGWSNVVYPDINEYMGASPAAPRHTTHSDYPGIYSGYYGPSADALKRADSPLRLFFYFLPVELWREIATATNEHFDEHLENRITSQLEYQRQWAQNHPSFKAKTRHLQSERPVLPHELCQYVGLLIARSICANKEKIANHWKTVGEGAIPRGCFGRFMARDRFMHISSNLHFSSNNDPRAATDRVWKIRPVLDILKQTFRRGYVLPPVLAFDEAMLPSRSRFNKLRVYLKDKPHIWAQSCFCCAAPRLLTASGERRLFLAEEFGYVVSSKLLISFLKWLSCRLEVYCGKAQHAAQGSDVDVKSGPAAVVRNLKKVFDPSQKPGEKRLVVTGRFYTSVTLALQLLSIDFYSVGTIITNRLGYAKSVIESRKKRPSSVPRGTSTIVTSLHVPEMKSVC